jgi:hypothetical protein
LNERQRGVITFCSFRRRIEALEADAPPLDAYALAADSSDIVDARCWVGRLAEAVRSPARAP